MTSFTAAAALSPSPSLCVVKDRIQQSGLHFIQADSNYSYLYFRDGSRLLTARTLKYWEAALSHIDLVRPHRKYLVNTRYVTAVNETKQCIVVGEHYIYASRRKWRECRNQLIR